jgi:hypothetical protein
MKRSFLLFILPALFGFPDFAVGQSNFTSEEGKFKVNFENTPELKTSEVGSGDSKIMLYIYLGTSSSGAVHLVGYSDHPDIVTNDNDAYSLMEGAKQGVASELKAKIRKPVKGRFQGYPSLDFKGKGQKLNFVYKMVVANNRLYQVGMMKYKKKITPAEVAGFIGSFKLL